MGNYKEDTNQNSGTIFFIIIFSLFVLIFSGNPESQTSASSRYSLQNELALGNISIHLDAIVFNAVNLSSLYKNREYKIYNYDQRTTQNFINIQKTRLVIEPLFLWRLCYPLTLGGKEDLPALS
jgi:hypothetical protein